jgi:large subunit ribosomal protein L21
MYAIVEIAGQQFKVVKDQKVFVHRLQTEEGKQVAFDNVLLLSNGDKVTIGAPAIGGAQVSAKVLKHLKGDKVIVFKKKRRKGYRVKNGHRQSLTEIQIEGIVTSGAKKATPAKATKAAAPKATAPKVETKPAAAKALADKKASPKAKVETKPVVKKETATQDLSKMTVAQLKEMAKTKGITGISSMKKADLIAALS